MRFLQEHLEVMQGAIGRVDICVVSNIIAVIFERRRVEGQQPDGGDPQGDRILIPCNDVDRRLESDLITGS